ncbi:hypothetical protein FAUST_4666 [Fusarium austroamericanum]|uniref:Heterokaryon incompatibility domain-containing protein n=1 Tax=Fusarium austroamericanum TaxID=282268 RepID=A0AAN6C2N0_FUSAU|nr:hypothetical protein FAUST_4666 [Fusarium austroamericanum]
MEYDLDQGFPPLNTADIFCRIKELYSLNTYRRKSEEWAHRDMQFLVYDDTDDITPSNNPPAANVDGYDSNDEESMLQYALRLSRQDAGIEQTTTSATIPGSERPAVERSPDECTEVTEFDSTREGTSHLSKTSSRAQQKTENAGSTSGQQRGTCKICSPLPEFPHDRRTRKLRLFRTRDVQETSDFPICNHYIPMSYCWASRHKDSNGMPLPLPGSYEIRELDGTIRMNRASDEVLDRAIDIAQTCGLRMIWVDQECLPQQDSEDREIGLQAMDIVYHRAVMTAGLHSTVITSSHHIRFISQLSSAFQQLEQGKMSWEYFNNLGLQSLIPTTLDFIGKVNQEKWYKRAWIAQESLSASGHLLLVFPLADGVRLDSLERQYRLKDAFQCPPSTLDKGRRGIPTTQWSIPDHEFKSLIHGISQFYSTNNRVNLSPAFLALKQHAMPILETASGLWPMEKRNKREDTIHMIGGASYGYRRKLSAAGALTIFRTRTCTRPHDRLAIMANMCRYDIRIDTRAAAARGGSLRVALLALATMNNDMSLFVPELYRPLHQGPGPSNTSSSYEVTPGTELFQPFQTSADRIECHFVDDGLRPRPRPQLYLLAHDVRRRGLNIPAYIWEVQGKMDLLILKYQWEDRWRALKASQSISDNASLSSVSPEFIESNPEARRQLVEIIFSILRHIHSLSDIDDRAQGVADSIWQSIRSAFISLPLPDNVGPALFDHSHVQVYDWDVLQLDHSVDNTSYNQLWFVERIMTDGALWVGRYTRCSQSRRNEEFRQILQSEEGNKAIHSRHVYEALLSQEFRVALRTADVQKLLRSEEAREALESEETRELLRSEDVRNALELDTICKLLHWDEAEFDDISDLIQKLSKDKTRRPDKVRSQSSDDASVTPKTVRLPESIMDRQLSYELIANIVQSRIESDTSIGLAEMRNNVPLVAASLLGLVWNAEVEANRLRRCVSVFDVHGPCIVATPFEFDLEVLPHSKVRHLSRCWVVEHVADEKIPQREDVAGGKKPASGIESVNIGVNAAMGNEGTRLYRVVGKVKGLWEIMELPQKAHYFI